MIKRGFSLMEMMVVMLIVAIIAAATAPMINKKMIQNASGESPWIWVSSLDNAIAFNLKGSDKAPAIIGGTSVPKEGATNIKSMFHIKSKGLTSQITMESDTTSDTTFGSSDKARLAFLAGKKGGDETRSFIFTNYFDNIDKAGNYVLVGSAKEFAKGFDGYSSVAVGIDVKSRGNAAVAVGNNATAQYRSVAIGEDTIAGIDTESSINGSVALGYGAKSEHKGSIAIGCGANTVDIREYGHGHAIAIGSNAESDAKSIAIGSALTEGIIGAVAHNQSIAIGSASTSAKGFSNIAIGNSVQIGEEVQNSVVLGTDIQSSKGMHHIAIGQDVKVGQEIDGGGDRSIAIGLGAAVGFPNRIVDDGIAIGYSARSYYNRSVAIGYGARTTAENQIVLGKADTSSGSWSDPATTVYIPGNLVVDGNVYLARNSSSRTYAGLEEKSGSSYYFRKLEKRDDNSVVGTDSGLSSSDVPLSDRRLKDVGEVFKSGLEEVKKLEVFNYTFKKDPNKTPRVGVMAQDLEKIFPKAVFKGDDGFLRIRMEDMFYAVVNAVKELDLKITAFVDELKTAVADITDLKIKSAEYEKTISELVEQNKAQAKALKDLEKRLAKLEKKAKKAEKTEPLELEIEE